MSARISPWRALTCVLTVLLVLVALRRSSEAADKLRVYTKSVEPFVFEKDGTAVGYSIDLWERIAQEAKLDYELVQVDTIPEMIDAVREGRADVAIGALSITAEREAVVDFTHPFYESGLQILVGPQRAGKVGSTVRAIFTLELLELLGVLGAALFGTSHLIWFFERKRNAEMFPASYRSGVWESFWWTTSVLVTGGCENKAPVGVGGRLVAIVWMVAGILLVSYVTASVTAVMTVDRLTGDIKGPADLPGQPVGTVVGSTAEGYLRDRRVDVRTYDSVDKAYSGLSSREVKAVVYDAPVLLHHVSKTGGGQERVIGPLFEKQNYGIALQRESQHRKPINEAMLRLKEAGFFEELQKKWFGDVRPPG
ncbi:MAG: transporter substrate-binding domain-containing protein [Polyangiaceae bacterium]